MSRYLRAIKKVFRNPKKIKFLPKFLSEEVENLKIQTKISLISKKKKSIADVEAEFYVNNKTEYWRVYSLMNEKRILRKVLKEINKEDIFLDVGANIGIYSCLIGDKIEGGNIIAVEPEPGNFERLNENLKLNNIEAETLKLALGDENKTVELEIDGRDTGGGKHRISTDKGKKESIEVKQRKLETILRENPEPDIMKIDVEGAELKVIRGMSMECDIRTIFCEIHTKKIEDFGASRRDVEEELRARSYKLEEMDKTGDQVFIKATKNE